MIFFLQIEDMKNIDQMINYKNLEIDLREFRFFNIFSS